MSGKHHSHFSHHSHQHPRSPDPNHLIIDSLHLLQLIKLPFINTHSTHAPHPVYRSLPRTVPDSLMLLTCVYLPFSFPRYSSDPPVLIPFVIRHTALAFLQRKRLSVSCKTYKGLSSVFLFTCHFSHRSLSLLLFNKPACYSLTCLCLARFVTEVWTRNQHLYGSPSAITCRGPEGTG